MDIFAGFGIIGAIITFFVLIFAWSLFAFNWLANHKGGVRMTALGVLLVYLTTWAFGTRNLTIFLAAVLVSVAVDIYALHRLGYIENPRAAAKWLAIYLGLQAGFSTILAGLLWLTGFFVIWAGGLIFEALLKNFNL